MTVNKTARDETERVILEYLEGLDSPELIRKINSTDKDIPDALSYVKEQVRSRAQNGCAMVSDQEVFGMVIHYFEEDSIQKGMVREVKKDRIEVVKNASYDKKPKEQPKPVKPKVITNEIEGQLSLF